jgi:hypothetical protein
MNAILLHGIHCGDGDDCVKLAAFDEARDEAVSVNFGKLSSLDIVNGMEFSHVVRNQALVDDSDMDEVVDVGTLDVGRVDEAGLAR